MKLTISCQTCGKVLAAIQKDQVTQDDINMYEAGAFCSTVAGAGVDGDGNPITLYDGSNNIQASMTQD